MFITYSKISKLYRYYASFSFFLQSFQQFCYCESLENNYKKKYGEDISKWFVDFTLKESGLANSPTPKKKVRVNI